MEKVICALGIDLTEDYIQISYNQSPKAEPISLSPNAETKQYLIPAALYYREQNDSWYIGDEAIFNSKSDKRNYYKYALDVIKSRELMKAYIENIIKLFWKVTSVDLMDDANICITIEETKKEAVKLILDVMSELGYANDRVRIINHDEAFVYYTINQKKELWVNDVALFDFTRNQFKYRRLHEIKTTNPPTIVVEEKDLSKDIYYALLENQAGKCKADDNLLELVRSEFKGHIVCTAYLTGEGFYSEWATESIREICDRRRVFKGYNLYVTGACYAALKRYSGFNKKHNFLCNGRTNVRIGLRVCNEGKVRIVELSDIGVNWYEAGARTQCILDDVTAIEIILINAMGETKEIKVDLSSFPNRPKKTTRIELLLAYRDDSSFDIVVKDMGFGEFFKSSGKIVKETIDTNEIFLG